MKVESSPLVGVLMGSQSDWETMQHCRDTLQKFEIPHECRVLSAHRTPKQTAEFVQNGERNGIRVFIAAAGGAAHLAGVVAAHTVLPVLGVPMKAWSLDGMDSLLATVQMPRGIPVGTLAIGKAGAINAAILAVSILSLADGRLAERLRDERRAQADAILSTRLE